MRWIANGLARVAVVAIALCGIAWAVVIGKSSDRSVQLDTLANRIMAGDSFSDSALQVSALQSAEDRPRCIPLEMRSATIIRLRQYESAIAAADVGAADRNMAALIKSLDKSLQCIPTDAFLWFIRYWILAVRESNAEGHIENLIMSYRMGPNEGWIALRRNVFALAVYRALPPDVAALVRAEFAALVDAGLIDVALNNLRRSGWPIREELAAGLGAVRPGALLAFDRALRRNEIQLAIPNVPAQEFRPWRW